VVGHFCSLVSPCFHGERRKARSQKTKFKSLTGRCCFFAQLQEAFLLNVRTALRDGNGTSIDGTPGKRRSKTETDADHWTARDYSKAQNRADDPMR
jgi:hypothetical protein